MSLEQSFTNNDQDLTITVAGEFGRKDLQEMRTIWADHSSRIKAMNIDLTNASFMDSDVSRYLLTLKMPASDNNIKLSIRTDNDQIKTTLRLMELDKVFKVN